MAERIERDADNKWETYVDWTAFIAEKAKSYPNGPGLTFTLTSSAWNESTGTLVEEAETQDIGNISHFVCSGGTNGNNYTLVCTGTFSVTELSATDVTQDQTIVIKLEEQ